MATPDCFPTHVLLCFHLVTAYQTTRYHNYLLIYNLFITIPNCWVSRPTRLENVIIPTTKPHIEKALNMRRLCDSTETNSTDRAIALRRLVAGFEPRSGHVGFVVGQVFSEYFRFPCQFSSHQMLHTHLPSGADTIGQLVDSVSPHLTKLKKKGSVPLKYVFTILHRDDERMICI
jgi:hypothetical protein